MKNTKYILHEIKRVSALTLLIAIFAFLYNFTFNGHFHYDNFGHLTYHFHPFNDKNSNNESKHSHTKIEYLTIDNYNHSNIFNIIDLDIDLKNQYSYQLPYIELDSDCISEFKFQYFHLRAPPELV